MSTKPSGLQLCDLSTGDGGRPKRGRKVRCNYSLRLGGPTGLLVEQSGSRPFEFRLGLGEVIKGWDEVRNFHCGFSFCCCRLGQERHPELISLWSRCR